MKCGKVDRLGFKSVTMSKWQFWSSEKLCISDQNLASVEEDGSAFRFTESSASVREEAVRARKSS